MTRLQRVAQRLGRFVHWFAPSEVLQCLCQTTSGSLTWLGVSTKVVRSQSVASSCKQLGSVTLCKPQCPGVSGPRTPCPGVSGSWPPKCEACIVRCQPPSSQQCSQQCSQHSLRRYLACSVATTVSNGIMLPGGTAPLGKLIGAVTQKILRPRRISALRSPSSNIARNGVS